MPLTLCCMSHSPLLNLPGPSQDLLEGINGALTAAREFVTAYDPELVVIFSPDHYNGVFYRMMPPFCISTKAIGVGDYGTQAGPLDVPSDIATDLAEAVLAADVDVASEETSRPLFEMAFDRWFEGQLANPSDAVRRVLRRRPRREYSRGKPATLAKRRSGDGPRRRLRYAALELVERHGQGFRRAIVERRRYHGRRGHHANQGAAVLGDLVGGNRQDCDDTEGDREPRGDPEPRCARDAPGQPPPCGRDCRPH